MTQLPLDLLTYVSSDLSVALPANPFWLWLGVTQIGLTHREIHSLASILISFVVCLPLILWAQKAFIDRLGWRIDRPILAWILGFFYGILVLPILMALGVLVLGFGLLLLALFIGLIFLILNWLTQHFGSSSMLIFGVTLVLVGLFFLLRRISQIRRH